MAADSATDTTSGLHASGGLKPLQAMEAARQVESYGGGGGGGGGGMDENVFGFMTPHHSHTSADVHVTHTHKPSEILLKKLQSSHSPTDSLIISKKLKEIDSRAKAAQGKFMEGILNATLSHGPQTKDEFFLKDNGQTSSPIEDKQSSELASLPAQVLSPENIVKLSGYRHDKKAALKAAQAALKVKNEESVGDPFHKKMAAYDNYLKHVGTNVIDTDACLRSDDPLKCENKEILKSSAVISKLDKELSKISSSAINELNQELSRTPSLSPATGAFSSKVDKTSTPKEFNNDVGEKFFDSPSPLLQAGAGLDSAGFCGSPRDADEEALRRCLASHFDGSSLLKQADTAPFSSDSSLVEE